ncbi:hypothetical protein MOBT1_002362 [Malassezia obtusa]|uniref:C2 domain-containing protein n=1 Tax=Malassezia obtusa TaxID=76774 RepID=A0AAF0E104_9BASI|nr:hypothetical protein MOBT1_002362 [Malassezia obtusa]
MAPRHRGTLVCVVLKAKNLPNKRSIGKQDPYAELRVGHSTQRTKADRRGGQQPLWDAQLHFEIYDALQHILAPETTAGHTLAIACYAEDKECELIGEATVPLDHVLQHGEHDLWIPLARNERYAGEVYVELTFYSLQLPLYGALGHGRPSAPAALAAHPQHGTLPVGTAARTTSTSHTLPHAHTQRNTSQELPRTLQVGHSPPVHAYTPPYAPHALRHASAATITPERPGTAPQRAWTVDTPEWTRAGLGTAGSPPPPPAPPPRRTASGTPPGAGAPRPGAASPSTSRPSAASPPYTRSPARATPPAPTHTRSQSTPGFAALPRSPGAHGLSPIASPPSMPRSGSTPWLAHRSMSAQWLPPLAADDSTSSAGAPDMLSQWNEATDTSTDDDASTDASASRSRSISRPHTVTTRAEVLEAAAAAMASPHASTMSAHEAIYGTHALADTSRPLPSPASVSGSIRRPLPRPTTRSDSFVTSSADASDPPPAAAAAAAAAAATAPPPRTSTPGALPVRPPVMRASTPVRADSPVSVSSPLASMPPITSMSSLAASIPRTSTPPAPTEPPPAYSETPPPPPLPPRRAATTPPGPPAVPPK